jgi:energy-coupling factor transporter ATP-binding protein EcfA2
MVAFVPTPSSRPTPSEVGTRANASAAPPTIVRFVGTSKTYDARTKVVDDLNLDVREGEFLTLLGPSGSGKTTCLMMLAGFEPWTLGRHLSNRWPACRRTDGVSYIVSHRTTLRIFRHSPARGSTFMSSGRSASCTRSPTAKARTGVAPTTAPSLSLTAQILSSQNVTVPVRLLLSPTKLATKAVSGRS